MDDDTEPDEGRFPISARDLSGVVSAIRRQIKRRPDDQLAGLTAALNAIERLPAATADLITIEASDRFGEGAGRAAGNYDWASIEITWCDMTFSTGEHVNDAGVGGDTQTETPFFCDNDGKVEGSLLGWLHHFERLAEYGVRATSEESSDPDLDDVEALIETVPAPTPPVLTPLWDFDGETVAMGLKLIALYIEDGETGFKDIACYLAADLNMTMKQLKRAGVRGWYEGARATLEDSGADVSGMDTPECVRETLEMLVTVAGWTATMLGTPPARA